MTAIAAFTSSSVILLKSIWSASKLYFFWILVHYASIHAYTYFCTPNSFIGFVKSPFMIITPQCHTLDWVQQKSREIIKNMWSLLAMWVSSIVMTKLKPKD